MNRRHILSIFAIATAFLAVAPASAGNLFEPDLRPAEVMSSERVPKAKAPGARSAREQWYSHWGIGLALPEYPGQLGRSARAVRNAAGIRHTSLGADLFGFHFPLSKTSNTTFGVQLNRVVEMFVSEADSSDSATISQDTVAVSMMHFFGPEIGEGIFGRFDVGTTSVTVSNSGGASATSDSGLGVLIGTGYGYGLSEDARLLLHLNYALRFIESERYQAGTASVGILF